MSFHKYPSILLLLLHLIPTPFHGFPYKYPALEKWVNSLDSEQKIESFASSNAVFGREIVTTYEVAGKTATSNLGGNGPYPLMKGFRHLQQSRRNHQLMLVFNTVQDYRQAQDALTKMNSINWMWLFFPIVQGPSSEQKPFSLDELTESEVETAKEFKLAFGFTSDSDWGEGSYLYQHFEMMGTMIDDWITQLEYTGNVMVELSMHSVLNNSNIVRAMAPILKRKSYVCMATTDKYSPLVLKRRAMMETLAKKITKPRLFLNIPENLRMQINPLGWYIVDTSNGQMGHKTISSYLILLPTILWLSNVIQQLFS